MPIYMLPRTRIFLHKDRIENSVIICENPSQRKAIFSRILQNDVSTTNRRDIDYFIVQLEENVQHSPSWGIFFVTQEYSSRFCWNIALQNQISAIVVWN